jgi:phosphoadenosine phosphosulfate reductase
MEPDAGITESKFKRKNPMAMALDMATEEANELSVLGLLEWSFTRFHPRLALACSFQAEESVLIDMMHRVRGSDFRVFTLDTGRLNQETYDCMDAIRTRYGIEIEVFFPDAAKVEGMVRRHGLNLFYDSVDLRKLCCGIRKVEPLNRALKELSAWMTGLRREQAVTRADMRKIEPDEDHGYILKINPLLDWSYEEIWRYIRENNVPYNRLHDKGYPSIGCLPCTRAIQPREDLRAGRWWWENPDTKECGLHVVGGKLSPAKSKTD